MALGKNGDGKRGNNENRNNESKVKILNCCIKV